MEFFIDTVNGSLREKAMIWNLWNTSIFLQAIDF